MTTIVKAYSLAQCMEQMAEYAHAYETQGDKNLIFCEDRLTLLAERALLKRMGGTFVSSVSTFARFLTTEEKVISKQGSVMAVGDVMTRLQREDVLQCFTTAAGVGNNAKCIYETLAQLSASEVTPDVLRESLSLLPDDMLKKKVADLAAIYEEYIAFLRENQYVDESKYLSLLPARIRKEGLLKDTNVFFLCFNSFTAQAAQTIRAALETAKNVIGVFCAGEEEIYTNRALQTFTRVCSDYGKLYVRDLGTPLKGEAEFLRKGLFNPERVEKRIETDNVHIFEADDKVTEAEYVATYIRRAMQENKSLHYRDFSILTPDVAGYSLPLKKALAEYDIPYFIDEKKSLKRHPLSRFLLDCFRTVRERFSPLAVQSLTENCFFGDSDAYRNYLLKFANYRGGAKRPIKTGEAVLKTFPDISDLEEGRARLLKATENIKARGHGRDYCLAVRKILNDFNAKERLELLEEEIGDLSQKAYLAQIYRALERVLEEAEMLTGKREMTIAEFEAVLQDGLDATEISLIPLKADAVFVGDITDSRIEKTNVLFAMGMTDAVPRNGTDTAIVSDKEIARLAEVKTLLEPTVAEVNMRSRESACLNLCAFTDALHLSYPLAADGSEPTTSEVFRYVDRMFCALGGGKLTREKKIPSRDFKYKCSAVAPAIRQLLIERNEYELRREDTRLEYSSLFSALDKLSVTEKDDYLAQREGHVRVECGEELFFKGGKISPTALENYFSCPFKHFVERGLKLRDREEAAVLAVDTGNFIHELLEKTASKVETTETEEAMRTLALEIGAEILKGSLYAMQQDTASDTVFSNKLIQEGAEVAVAAYRQIKNSDFKVEETEKQISSEEFHGKVDRVDGTDKYVRIIDYKTGAIDDKASSYYTGRKLQMQLYMSEIKGERIPAGVFYFPASVDYTADEEGKFRMQGFLNGDREALLCGDKNITEERKSEYFPAALKNSAVTKRVMDEETFRNFLDYSVYVARQGCKELREGNIQPSPYAGSCDYCKYGGMCGFNKETQTVRSETDIDTKTIAEIARITREGKEE